MKSPNEKNNKRISDVGLKSGETFDYHKEDSNSVWNENFVFKASENKITFTNDEGDSGREENLNHSKGLQKQKTSDDRSKQNEQAEANNSSTNINTEAAAETASASAATASTTGGVIATVATAVTTAVVVVVGGSIVINQTIDKPNIVEFQELSSTANTIDFKLAIGDDEQTITSEQQKDCSIVVELTCESYTDFKKEISIDKYGISDGTFNGLQPETEYTINVISNSILELDVTAVSLIEPIKITTQNGEIGPTSFAIDPASAHVYVDQTVELKLSNIVPENASTSVTWSSSNKDIATVNGKGVVTGIKSSDTPIVITATSTLDESVKATAQIYVDQPDAIYTRHLVKVADPFDNVSYHISFEVKYEIRTFDAYAVELLMLEPEESRDPISVTLQSNDITQDQLIDTYYTIEGEGVYKFSLLGLTTSEAQEEQDDGSSGGGYSGYDVTNLFEETIDFATLEYKQEGTDTHSNTIYLNKTRYYNPKDYSDLKTVYRMFIDTKEEVVEQYDRYLVGVYDTTIAEPNLENYSGLLYPDALRKDEMIEFDADISESDTYNFVVWGVKKIGEQDQMDTTMIYQEKIALPNRIKEAYKPGINKVDIRLEKTYYQDGAKGVYFDLDIDEDFGYNPDYYFRIESDDQTVGTFDGQIRSNTTTEYGPTYYVIIDSQEHAQDDKMVYSAFTMLEGFSFTLAADSDYTECLAYEYYSSVSINEEDVPYMNGAAKFTFNTSQTQTVTCTVTISLIQSVLDTYEQFKLLILSIGTRVVTATMTINTSDIVVGPGTFEFIDDDGTELREFVGASGQYFVYGLLDGEEYLIMNEEVTFNRL